MSRFFSAAAIAAALSVAVHATVNVPLEFREVVASATLIVFGHVTDVRTVVLLDGSFESVATVAVDDTIKGEAGAFVSVHVPGGTIGRIRSVMIDAPRFDAGEQAVLFLKRGPDSAWRPVGLSMGVYRVQAEVRTGVALVDPPLMMGQTASAGPVVRGDPRRKLMTLKEFTSLVRLVVAAQGLPASAGRR